jgi:hypothetical protein
MKHYAEFIPETLFSAYWQPACYMVQGLSDRISRDNTRDKGNNQLVKSILCLLFITLSGSRSAFVAIVARLISFQSYDKIRDYI